MPVAVPLVPCIMSMMLGVLVFGAGPLLSVCSPAIVAHCSVPAGMRCITVRSSRGIPSIVLICSRSLIAELTAVGATV